MAKLILVLGLVALGCGGATSGTPDGDAGLGVAGDASDFVASVGGEVAVGVAGASAMATGGALGVGGSLATGGASVGGTDATGGAVAVGGSLATGGGLAGGADGVGGSSLAGSVAGGAVGVGGAATGGAAASGGAVGVGGASVSPTVCRTLCNDDFNICSSERLFELTHCGDTCEVHREMCALDCSGVIDACITVCVNNEATCSNACFSTCLDDCNTRACDYLDCDGEQTKCSATCQTNYTARMSSICFAERSTCLAACPT